MFNSVILAAVLCILPVSERESYCPNGPNELGQCSTRQTKDVDCCLKVEPKKCCDCCGDECKCDPCKCKSEGHLRVLPPGVLPPVCKKDIARQNSLQDRFQNSLLDKLGSPIKPCPYTNNSKIVKIKVKNVIISVESEGPVNIMVKELPVNSNKNKIHRLIRYSR